MSDPDRHYRRLLTLYPKSYRHAHGQEVFATLLDAAGGRGRPTFRDGAAILMHASKLHISALASRFGRGRLPRSVHWATNLLVFVAASSWFRAATSANGPRNPTSNVGNIVVGIALIVLCLLLRAWSRILYVVVIGTLLAFAATVIVDTTPFYAGIALSTPFLVPIALLVMGWRRYMRARPSYGSPQGQQHTLAS